MNWTTPTSPRDNPMLYKVLNADGSPCNGGNGKWHLSGEWMPPIEGELVPCQNGYHLCRREDLIRWLGPTIYTAEYRGDIIESDDKVVVREARLIKQLPWSEVTARLFAADCAEHVLHHYERHHPNDDRPRRAIEAARAYARGEIEDAAGDAAWATAWDAAGDAAWDAERQWQTERLFSYLESDDATL